MRLLLMVAILNSGCSLLLDGGQLCSGDACPSDAGSQVGSGVVLEGVASDSTPIETDNLSFSYTIDDRNQLVLVFASARSASASFESVTFGSDDMHREQPVVDGDEVRLEVWSLFDPPMGQHDVDLTASSDKYLTGGAMVFSGVDPARPIGAVLADDGADSISSISVESISGDLVVDAIGEYDSDGLNELSFDPSQTETWRVAADDGDYRLAASTKPGAEGNTTMSASMASAPDYSHLALTVRAASAGN